MWTVLPRGSYLTDQETGRDTRVVAMNVGDREVGRDNVTHRVSFLGEDLKVLDVVAPHQVRLTLGGGR